MRFPRFLFKPSKLDEARKKKNSNNRIGKGFSKPLLILSFCKRENDRDDETCEKEEGYYIF